MADDPSGSPRGIDEWPAAKLRELPGDVFGNGSSFLWRCELCGGHFIHSGRSMLDLVLVVGLVLHSDDDAREGERAAIWAEAEHLVASSACACPYRGEGFDETFSDPAR